MKNTIFITFFFVLISVGCFAFAQDTTFSEKYFKLINAKSPGGTLLLKVSFW